MDYAAIPTHSPNRHFVSINYVWSIYHAGNVSYVNWKQNAANSWNGWFTMIWQCGADRSFYGLTSIRFLSCSHVKKNLAAFRSICKGLLYNEASYIHGILIPYITLTFRFNFHLLYVHLRMLIMVHRIFISDVPECKGDK